MKEKGRGRGAFNGELSRLTSCELGPNGGADDGRDKVSLNTKEPAKIKV